MYRISWSDATASGSQPDVHEWMRGAPPVRMNWTPWACRRPANTSTSSRNVGVPPNVTLSWDSHSRVAVWNGALRAAIQASVRR